MQKWLSCLVVGLLVAIVGASAATAQTPIEIVKEEWHALDGARDIYGYFTAPKDYQAQQSPVIVLAHGFGGRAESLDFYAQAFAKAGYVVYSFDFMGGNPNSRSGQDTLAMSPFTEQEDLHVVITQLKKQPYVKVDAIFLLGQSQGGVVATMEATDYPDSIKGLMLLYPAFVLFDDARSLFKSVDEIPAVYNHRGNNVGKVYFERSLDYDIYAKMPAFQQPVAIAHGTKDEVVPLDYAKRAKETFPSANLLEVDGAGHMFNQAQNAQAAAYYLEYLANQLKEN